MITYRRTSEEVTLDRLDDYLRANRDVLNYMERNEIERAIAVISRVDPVLRRVGR